MDIRSVKAMGKEEVTNHGLAEKGWRFVLDNAKRRFGCCNYRLKLISISRPLAALNDEARVRNTILHEIAHALTGPGAGHGPAWVLMAKSIGCDGERCYSSIEVQGVKRPFVGICPKCGRKIERFKRKKISCGLCCKNFNGGRFAPEFLFRWERN